MSLTIIIILFFLLMLYYYRYSIFDTYIKYRHIYNIEPLNKEICTTNLILFKQTCDTCQIPFWLSEGTALGMRRNQDFIDWDDDVDIGIPIRYLPQFKKCAVPLLKQQGFLFGNKLQNGTFWNLFRNNEKIDIDFTGYNNQCMSVYNKPCEFIIDTLSPFQYVLFKNNWFAIPSDKYFETIYGPEWHIPTHKKSSNYYTFCNKTSKYV